MVILDAIPKDIHFIVDISLEDMEDLKLILDNMVFNYDSSIQEHERAKQFLENILYPTVTESLKSIKDGN